MNHNEWQTDDSIPAAPADEATEQAADLLIAAADEDKLTPVKLGQLLVSVGRTVSDEDDLLTLLQRVVEIAHEAIDGADSTSLTIDLGGRTYTAVHTDDRTLRVDSEQYDAGDGPCLEASRTGTVVLVNADDTEDRWPRFTAAAREEEILSFLAAPLTTGEQSLGSFNLYGRTRSAFDTLDAEVLELLTTTVSRTLGDFARFKSARDVADSIQRALQTRAPIEQAKGILMALHGIDADKAFDLLRRESQATNTRLHTVATELVTRLSTPATDDSLTTDSSPDCSH
jgi:transcriptional regulator with GAF, ATPase, and Fis domain